MKKTKPKGNSFSFFQNVTILIVEWDSENTIGKRKAQDKLSLAKCVQIEAEDWFPIQNCNNIFFATKRTKSIEFQLT